VHHARGLVMHANDALRCRHVGVFSHDALLKRSVAFGPVAGSRRSGRGVARKARSADGRRSSGWRARSKRAQVAPRFHRSRNCDIRSTPDPGGTMLARAIPLVLLAVSSVAFAQSPQTPQSAPSPEQARAKAVDDLVMANRILVDQGVLDGYGHVSIRVPGDAKHFLLTRPLSPEL